MRARSLSAAAILLSMTFLISGCATVRPAPKVCFGVIGRCVDKAVRAGMDAPRQENACVATCVRYGLVAAERAYHERFPPRGKNN